MIMIIITIIIMFNINYFCSAFFYVFSSCI